MSCIHNAGKNGIYNEGDEFMAGQITHCASGVIPAGWLECNGAAVSRTTYGTLFAAIGTNYGAGDGVGTFNLPDLRGEFIRGADRGRGVDAARAVGSAQGDAIRNISGTVAGGASLTRVAGGEFGALRYGEVISNGESLSRGQLPGYSTVNGMTLDASRVVPTAAENRPRNIALIPIIKYS